jgi:hypothetical protein
MTTTKYEEEKLRGRRNRIKKTLRKKKMGLIPPTKDERLEAALKPLAEAGATREQLNEAVWASVNAWASVNTFHQDVAISAVIYERILDRLTSPKSLPTGIALGLDRWKDDEGITNGALVDNKINIIAGKLAGNTFHGTPNQVMLAKHGWRCMERKKNAKRGCVWIVRWLDPINDGVYNQENAVCIQRERNKQKRLNASKQTQGWIEAIKNQ